MFGKKSKKRKSNKDRIADLEREIAELKQKLAEASDLEKFKKDLLTNLQEIIGKLEARFKRRAKVKDLEKQVNALKDLKKQVNALRKRVIDVETDQSGLWGMLDKLNGTTGNAASVNTQTDIFPDVGAGDAAVETPSDGDSTTDTMTVDEVGKDDVDPDGGSTGCASEDLLRNSDSIPANAKTG